ncbi:sodium-dependent lysophosphatidylcholine symporter 1-B-like isoform X4 [Dermochelys coriacea]|uniref:sodium-dependent lysophosphatidylcholine symporter 1-B-like isoform X4 n=1 Tax=Dermochelys coriacea TaxID=27794 RepID=UPI001CA87577|nr:sodium-dependent lysophosphatidylcholine symporter 1-B-like isoform X4 [Dermochelys coriacea]
MFPESPGNAGDSPAARSRRSEMQPAPLLFYRKLCYAIGGAPYQMTGNALGFFLQIFLVDVVQLDPFHSSLILFLGRAWDAVTDPAVGFLISKSPRRRFGKLIPWIIFSMPFGVVFYCMIWVTLSDAVPVSLKFLWYLAMYCFFQMSMSCYHVPYSSLTMFLGGNPRDRDSATAYRMGVEVFSTLVGSGIQGQIVGGYHASMMKSCSMANGPLYNITSPGLTDTLENTRRAYWIASVVLGLLYCTACLILFFGVKEQPGPLSPLGKTQLPFFCSLRKILRHQPYVQLLCGFLFMSLAFQVVASLSIPFWQWFLEHFGKKPAVFVGLSLIIPALIVITQVSHNFLVVVFMMVLAGCSLAVLYLLPWSMLPDAVDDFRLKNPNYLNLEAFLYSFYVFFNKFAGGLSLGISAMSLHFAGYRASDCTHNPSVILTLQILMAPVPIILLLIAMAIFYFYPINEERRKQMRVEMEAAGSRGLLQGVSLGPPNASEEG